MACLKARGRVLMGDKLPRRFLEVMAGRFATLADPNLPS
jgi:hypothetical protein